MGIVFSIRIWVTSIVLGGGGVTWCGTIKQSKMGREGVLLGGAKVKQSKMGEGLLCAAKSNKSKSQNGMARHLS